MCADPWHQWMAKQSTQTQSHINHLLQCIRWSHGCGVLYKINRQCSVRELLETLKIHHYDVDAGIQMNGRNVKGYVHILMKQVNIGLEVAQKWYDQMHKKYHYLCHSFHR